MLDRTERRILGVLIEKELSVPDSYPLTANALLAGCNQKSNREPEMSFEMFEVDGAVLAMQLNGWVTKTEGTRAPRYRHELAKKLALDDREKAVMAELLLRGPQAAGALKARVARMGFAASSPAEVEEVLLALRDRPTALVQLLPRAPRERDARWTHLLAPTDESGAPAATTTDATTDAPTEFAGPAVTPPAPAAGPPMAHDDFEQRLLRVEHELATLRHEVRELRALLPGAGGSDAAPSTTTEL